MKEERVMETTAGADLQLIVANSPGWHAVSSGSVGALWTGPRNVEVGIPHNLAPDSPEWPGVIERVAYGLGTTEESFVDRITIGFRHDVTDFRASGDGWGHYVPVEAGVDLFTTAKSLLRTSATTARVAKPVIGGNYSAPGDRVVAEARFGQTREGSYVVPLIVPVATRAEDDAQRQPELEPRDGTPVFRNASIESEARRATRTMAQSLAAIWTQIVEPERVPGDRLVHDLVTAGISREMLRSLSEVLAHPAVREFDTEFHWAEHPSTPAPDAPPRVALPAESTGLLNEVAQRFREKRETPVESLSGQIVELRDEAAGIGAITLATVRNSRNVEILVPLRGKALDEAHAWFASREVILVRSIIRSRGGRLRAEAPETVGPIGQVAFDY